MKTRKYEIGISLIFMIVSFVVLFFLKSDEVKAVCIGILSSSVLSFVLGITSYIILKKQKIMELVVETFDFDNKGYAKLYRENKDLSTGEVYLIISDLMSLMYKVYLLLFELLNGLFFKKKLFLIIKQIRKAEDIIIRLRKIELDTREEKIAGTEAYKLLTEIVEDATIFDSTKKIAQSLGVRVYQNI